MLMFPLPSDDLYFYLWVIPYQVTRQPHGWHLIILFQLKPWEAFKKKILSWKLQLHSSYGSKVISP